MKNLYSLVRSHGKLLLPTEQLAVGDCLHFENVTGGLPVVGVQQQLQTDCVRQNKTLVWVSPYTVCCVRTLEQIWPAALAATPARETINNHNGTLGFEFISAVGASMEVLALEGHNYFAYKPLNMPSLRVYASRAGHRTGHKYAVRSTGQPCRALVQRVA